MDLVIPNFLAHLIKLGTLMNMVIWKNQINMFREKLSKGYAIIMRNFKVSEITGEYISVYSNF